MVNWMRRGLAFAVAMVVIRLVQGALINTWQTQSGLLSVALLVLFVIGVAVWGVIDGRADAKASPDPDWRQDLGMPWLLAGLLAGLVSGAVSWLISRFYHGLYVGGLFSELTTFAAFTALMVFVPGVIGVAGGRWRVDRQYAKQPVKHHGLAADQERADTDVFAAVRADETPTEQPAGTQTEERATAVATTEREEPTEAEAPTEVIRTDAEEAEPDPGPQQG